MGKRKTKATGDNAGSGASGGNAATVAYVRYCREHIQAFITKLKADCAYIRETVEESLYRDGRGLLSDDDLRKRIGTLAYIDNFFRHFGACLNFADIGAFMSDMLPDDLYTAGGITDLKKLERVPALDKKLLKDITGAGNDDTWARNMTVYFFALWVNYHVSPVVAAFRKWLEITGDNAPAILRDYNALARCVCVFTLTEDNTTGGFFYDGGWFETFAICGMKRQANAGDRPTGAANPSGTADGQMVINASVVKLNAGNVETPAPKGKPAGRGKGISQADFAALLKHYGGRLDGKAYKVRAIKVWDAHPEKRPMAGGVIYSPELRNDPIAARKWAMDFNAESQARWNARKSGLRRFG